MSGWTMFMSLICSGGNFLPPHVDSFGGFQIFLILSAIRRTWANAFISFFSHSAPSTHNAQNFAAKCYCCAQKKNPNHVDENDTEFGFYPLHGEWETTHLPSLSKVLSSRTLAL